MTRSSLLPLAALVAVMPRPAAAEHPIAAVITLIEKLEVEAQQEGASEEETYQKFTYWCKRSTKKLSRSIKKAKKEIDELTDKISGLNNDIPALADDITALEGQLEVLDQQAQKAKKLRADENGLYKEDVANLDGTIGATDEAIVTLKETEVKFLQKSSRHVAQGPEDLLKLDPGKNSKPKPKVFSNHEGGVIETFKALEDGWNIDKLSEEEQETNAINAYKLAKQARDTAIDAAKKAKSEKEGIKSDKESELAQAESSKSDFEKEVAGDATSLEDTDTECKKESAEYEERTSTRKSELEAMDMAKKILAKVSGVRNPDEHEIPTKSLLEFTNKVQADTSDFESMDASLSSSFLQIDNPRKKAAGLLRRAARHAHSKRLQRLAAEIANYAGPFDKIKGMINKMIFELMGEQKDEDEHYLWCEKEQETSTEAKDDKSEKVTKLTAAVTELDTAIKLLVKQITENEKKTADITDYMKQETELRDTNHAEIEATIKDAQDAQGALTEAVGVLKKFYKESGEIPKEPWEFLQLGSHRDSSSTGASGGGDKILTILEDTRQKFSTMEADAKVTDETDQKDFETDMAAKKVVLAETATDTQMKTAKKDSLQQEMEGEASSLKSESSGLDAVEQYLKDLEPACGTGDSSYEDRKKARADEIEALRKAQTILEDAFRQK